MNEERFRDQLWRLLDGDLPPEDFAELENHLSSDPEARAKLIDHIDLHNILDLRLSAAGAGGARWEGVVAMDQVLDRQRYRALRYSAIGAAALLVLVGIVLALFLTPGREPAMTFRVSKDSIWNVSHREGHDAKDPLALVEGSRLELRQGAVELTMESGVTARIKAPADFTVQADDLIRQDLGVIHYRVPKQAAGFRVESPQLRIKDLGTEFGVICRPGQPDEAHLFSGSIEVRSTKGVKAMTVLKTPQARVVGPAGALEPTDLRADEFMSELADGIPYLHFPFDEINGVEVPVSGDSDDLPKISAWIEEPGSRSGASFLTGGKSGRALRLSGEGEFVQTNWPGIGGRNPRTVAFWMRLPKDAPVGRFQGILVWGDTRDSRGKFSVNWNFIPQSGNLGALRFNAADGNVVGQTDLRDGAWHHLAVVFGGDTDLETGMGVTLYVDGVAEAPSGYRYGNPDTVRGTDPESWLSIGRFFDVDTGNRGTLAGDLDELYIFEGVLSAESIRSLMVSGWPHR